MVYLSYESVYFMVNFFFITQDVLGVTLGAIIGHSLCTGLAVLGGRMIAQKISVKTGTYHLITLLTASALFHQ